MPTNQCRSIKSKKNKHLRCPNPATQGKGEWCAKHVRSMIHWESDKPGFTKKQITAAQTIFKFWIRFGRPSLYKKLGPAVFCPELSHNDKDIYTYESITKIPLTYHFSYKDNQTHIWTFDLRFLTQLLQYEGEIKNPFSQSLIPQDVLDRLQKRTEHLRKKGKAILYTESDELTPEQIWNQKVLDVFLKLTSLGYGCNVAWFETLTVKGHYLFYSRLFNLWNVHLGLTQTEKERIVPGHASGRNPLFRWFPEDLAVQFHDIKWWRKNTLTLMTTFLTRSTDKTTQGCGALYILTALAQTHPRVAESYPYLIT